MGTATLTVQFATGPWVTIALFGSTKVSVSFAIVVVPTALTWYGPRLPALRPLPLKVTWLPTAIGATNAKLLTTWWVPAVNLKLAGVSVSIDGETVGQMPSNHFSRIFRSSLHPGAGFVMKLPQPCE